MTTSRRDFLQGLVLAPALLAAASYEISTANGQALEGRLRSVARLPVLTNYNDTGTPVLIEGKTLLIALAFATPVTDPHGTFPVSIQPTADGEPLEEKQPLSFYLSPDRKITQALNRLTFGPTILSAPLDPVAGKSYSLRFDAYGGADAKGSFSFTIREGTYRSSVLTLAREFTDRSPAIDAQIAGDFQKMVEVLKIRTPR